LRFDGWSKLGSMPGGGSAAGESPSEDISPTNNARTVVVVCGLRLKVTSTGGKWA
jgi:hypothetical protein